MPDMLESSVEMLRVQVAHTPRIPDCRKRSEGVCRLAKMEGPVLDAVIDAMRVLAPDPELDRILRIGK